MPRIKTTPFGTIGRRLSLPSIVVVLLLLSGCSSMRLAYNTADFFIGHYADDYLGLDGTQMERFLTDWLVEYRDMPSPLEFAQAELRQGFTELLMRLDATLDAGQRRKLIDPLVRLRADFMALQKGARTALVGC